MATIRNSLSSTECDADLVGASTHHESSPSTPPRSTDHPFGINRSGRVLARVGLSALTLLLVGCPNPNLIIPVDSTEFATSEIGFNLVLRQIEESNEISLSVTAIATTDGMSATARRARITEPDTLKVSVQNQDLEPTRVFPEKPNSATRFTYSQAELVLPATFRVQLIRNGDQPDARDTYVTIKAVFETLSPREGDVFSRDGTAEFAWTLRDGDGNAVGSTEAIPGVWSRERLTTTQRIPAVDRVSFETTAIGPDGISRKGSLPSIALVPVELRNSRTQSWALDVNLSSDNNNLVLPASFDVDPALANASAGHLFLLAARPFPKRVPVTVR